MVYIYLQKNFQGFVKRILIVVFSRPGRDLDLVQDHAPGIVIVVVEEPAVHQDHQRIIVGGTGIEMAGRIVIKRRMG